ncbi:metallophosphoesterase family protein [Paenibacillus hodogayensis]|uniref:Metallophosphoesterase family protein n=1 Tax=Paenibacillus hodogayensis TaxID=279208 RepID=A0ABV5VUL5_9BACL
MKRTVMISDIHGCIKQFNQLLLLIEYNPIDDQLILLGDYVDRGPDSKAVVDRVIELVRNNKAIALRGNHDQRLYDLVNSHSKEVRIKFLEHGGIQTIQSYCGSNAEITEERLQQGIEMIRTNYRHHTDFLGQLPLYYEDNHHIYVHAGLNPSFTDWKKQSERDFMYIKDEFIRSSFDLKRKVIFGHTRTVDIHTQPDIWFSEDKIGIDGGCAYGMQLNCLIFQDGKYITEHIKWSRT